MTLTLAYVALRVSFSEIGSLHGLSNDGIEPTLFSSIQPSQVIRLPELHQFQFWVGFKLTLEQGLVQIVEKPSTFDPLRASILERHIAEPGGFERIREAVQNGTQIPA